MKILGVCPLPALMREFLSSGSQAPHGLVSIFRPSSSPIREKSFSAGSQRSPELRKKRIGLLSVSLSSSLAPEARSEKPIRVSERHRRIHRPILPAAPRICIRMNAPGCKSTHRQSSRVGSALASFFPSGRICVGLDGLCGEPGLVQSSSHYDARASYPGSAAGVVPRDIVVSPATTPRTKCPATNECGV